MAQILNFDEYDNHLAIEIPRTEEFHKAAEALSRFIKELPLSNSDNAELIELIIEQVLEAERSGYKFGIKLAGEVYEHKDELME